MPGKSRNRPNGGLVRVLFGNRVRDFLGAHMARVADDQSFKIIIPKHVSFPASCLETGSRHSEGAQDFKRTQSSRIVIGLGVDDEFIRLCQVNQILERLGDFCRTANRGVTKPI